MIVYDEEENGEYSFIDYHENILEEPMHMSTWKWLDNMDDFETGETSYGTQIPRIQKWLHEEMAYFGDWKADKIPRWESHEYDIVLYNLQEQLQNKVDCILEKYPTIQTMKFNSCLMNVYADENKSIKLHSDTMTAFGDTPLIAVYSTGETRDIYFYRKKYNEANHGSTKLDKTNKDMNFKITLKPNSLLIMGGATQKYYAHEVPKSTTPKKKRISLTFRNHSAISL
jgi:alkylated DNA repair dioxygenase AlkB